MASSLQRKGSATLYTFSDPNAKLTTSWTTDTGGLRPCSLVLNMKFNMTESTKLKRKVYFNAWIDIHNYCKELFNITEEGNKIMASCTYNGYLISLSDLLQYGNCPSGKTAGNIVYLPVYWNYTFWYSYLVGWKQSFQLKSKSFNTEWVIPGSGVGGGNFSCSPLGTVYKPASWTITASWSGVDLGTNASATWSLQRRINGGSWTTIGSTQSSSKSGSVSAYEYAASSSSRDTYTYRFHITWDGGSKDVELGSKSVLPPGGGGSSSSGTPPSMGYLNNTTAEQINDIQTKTISANWGISDAGYPAGTITYEYHCYSSTYGEIKSGETTGNSMSFAWNMPARDVRDTVYWRVRAKGAGGWSGFLESTRATVYWGYSQPVPVGEGSVRPNSFQLYNGSTNISFTASVVAGDWGNTPGTKCIEFALRKNGSTFKYFGKNSTTTSGTVSQSVSVSVPETDLNNRYEVMAYKTVGTSKASESSLGYISFYEIIGRVSGTLQLDPEIVLAGIPSKVNYSWSYEKESSERVRFYLEVYSYDLNRVTKTINLDSNVTSTKSSSGSTTNILVDASQSGLFEIRYKAVVTELLGNTNTYTLATAVPRVYTPPRGKIEIENVSRPLPTTNPKAKLALQDTDIDFKYSYECEGVVVTKAVIMIKSSPFGTEQIEVECDPNSPDYENFWTRLSNGEFALGSTVSAYLILYYQLEGSSTTYTIQSNPATLNISTTRYLFHLAHTTFDEKELNKLHPVVNNVERISMKIHVD